MDSEQLRRALIEQGFTEAAAMGEADIERQRLDEEEEADVTDLTAARHRQSSDWDWDDAA